MRKAELYRLWQAPAGTDLRNKDRPAFVLEHAAELDEHTDTSDPVPVDGTMRDAREWLDRFKPVVTRQLTPTGDDSGETPTETDGVGDA